MALGTKEEHRRKTEPGDKLSSCLRMQKSNVGEVWWPSGKTMFLTACRSGFPREAEHQDTGRVSRQSWGLGVAISRCVGDREEREGLHASTHVCMWDPKDPHHPESPRATCDLKMSQAEPRASPTWICTHSLILGSKWAMTPGVMRICGSLFLLSPLPNGHPCGFLGPSLCFCVDTQAGSGQTSKNFYCSFFIQSARIH